MNKKDQIKQWTRLEVIKDYKFYIVSLNMLAGPWIITGIFIYQSFISEAKDGIYLLFQKLLCFTQ